MEQHLFKQLSRRFSPPPVAPTLFHLDRAWRTAYEALLKFAEREGHLQIPTSVTVDGLPLGKWRVSQISRYHSQTLSHEKTRLLERIPGWQWSDRDAAPLLSEKEDHQLETVSEKQAPSRRIIAPSADPPQAHLIIAPSADPPKTRRAMAPRAERAKPLNRAPGPSSEKTKGSSRLPKGWAQGLSSLLAFVERSGHCDVPTDHLESGFPLGDWVMIQRYAFLRGELQKQKIQHLERVSGWTWDVPGRDKKSEPKEEKVSSSRPASSPIEESEEDLLRWQIFYPRLWKVLKQQRASHAAGARLPHGTPLAKWVEEIRKRYHRGSLLPAQVKNLESLEGWSWTSTVDDWEDSYACLEAMIAEHGTYKKSQSHLQEHPALKKWKVQQRREYARGRLPEDKRRRLESLPGFLSETEKNRLWSETFEHLWFFIRKEKHAQVPKDYVVEGVPLGAWVTEQRRLYRHGELAELRIRKLEALGLWTWKPEPVTSQP
jgi:hypothetical protein